jgi:hypothetical protein
VEKFDQGSAEGTGNMSDSFILGGVEFPEKAGLS